MTIFGKMLKILFRNQFLTWNPSAPVVEIDLQCESYKNSFVFSGIQMFLTEIG